MRYHRFGKQAIGTKISECQLLPRAECAFQLATKGRANKARSTSNVRNIKDNIRDCIKSLKIAHLIRLDSPAGPRRRNGREGMYRWDGHCLFVHECCCTSASGPHVGCELPLATKTYMVRDAMVLCWTACDDDFALLLSGEPSPSLSHTFSHLWSRSLLSRCHSVVAVHFPY
jgi:hypothetical protein